MSGDTDAPEVEETGPNRKKSTVVFESTTATIGLVTVSAMVLLAVAAPVIAPHPPVDGSWPTSLDRSLMPPFWQEGGSLQYPLGTDEQGRDILSRILFGLRLALIQGVAPVIIASCIGIFLGLLAGFYGGWVDEFISALIDSVLSIPLVVLAIAIIGVLGASLLNLILVIGFTQWAVYARTIRGETLSIKNEEFVEAQKVSGASKLWVIREGILPNTYSTILVMVTLNVAQVMIIAAGLTFLGFGVNPPQADLGLMLSQGRDFLLSAWWYGTFPGLFLMLFVLGINLVGDGLRDILDPKQLE